MFRNKNCVPCEDKNTAPLSREVAEEFIKEIPEWKLLDSAHALSREFEFDTFPNAIEFINQVAGIAETEGHHPDIFCFYNKVRLELSTHSISGLSENDFIVAAKIDGILM